MRLIDADALITEYDRVHIGEPGKARKLIEDAPTIEPERTGHWISDTGKPVKMYNGCPVSACYCSERGDWLGASDEYDITGRYCPNCGARMEP